MNLERTRHVWVEDKRLVGDFEPCIAQHGRREAPCGEATDFSALTDAIYAVVKLPSILNDKY